MIDLYQWALHHMPVWMFQTFQTSRVLFVIVMAVGTQLIIKSVTKRAIAHRRKHGPTWPRLVAWLRVPILPATRRAMTSKERVHGLTNIAEKRRYEAEAAQIINLPVLPAETDEAA